MTEGRAAINKIISSRTERFLAATGLAVFGVGCFLVGYFNPSAEKFFPACPILVSTGYACSGCGLTRGFHALFHGDILNALSYNALIPFYVFVFGFFVLHLLFVVIRGKGFSLKLFSPWFLGGFIVLAIGFAFIRNLPFYPFSVLFP